MVRSRTREITFPRLSPFQLCLLTPPSLTLFFHIFMYNFFVFVHTRHAHSFVLSSIEQMVPCLQIVMCTQVFIIWLCLVMLPYIFCCTGSTFLIMMIKCAGICAPECFFQICVTYVNSYFPSHSFVLWKCLLLLFMCHTEFLWGDVNISIIIMPV